MYICITLLHYCFSGLGFRPMPNGSDALSSLIWYRGTKKEDYAVWVESLSDFVKGNKPFVHLSTKYKLTYLVGT